MRVLEYLSVYVFGGIAYGSLERMYRGHTHWTMLVTGGLCCCLIHYIANHFHISVWKKALLCAAVITCIELWVGWLVNVQLGWHVWDYTGQWCAIGGQICPLFVAYWYLLSLPCLVIAQFLRRYVFVSDRHQSNKMRRAR